MFRHRGARVSSFPSPPGPRGSCASYHFGTRPARAADYQAPSETKPLIPGRRLLFGSSPPPPADRTYRDGSFRRCLRRRRSSGLPSRSRLLSGVTSAGPLVLQRRGYFPHRDRGADLLPALERF